MNMQNTAIFLLPVSKRWAQKKHVIFSNPFLFCETQELIVLVNVNGIQISQKKTVTATLIIINYQLPSNVDDVVIYLKLFSLGLLQQC